MQNITSENEDDFFKCSVQSCQEDIYGPCMTCSGKYCDDHYSELNHYCGKEPTTDAGIVTNNSMLTIISLSE